MPIWHSFVSDPDFRIRFAHRTFEWGSDARGKAHVHVVIVGFQFFRCASATLFDYENQRDPAIKIAAKNINPYLIDGPNLIVQKRSSPITPRQLIRKGSEATDWGYLTLTAEEAKMLSDDPSVLQGWIRPFWGGDELINGEERFCLWLKGVDPAALRASKIVMDRVQEVRKMREASTKARTKEIAAYSHLFGEDRQPNRKYLLIPKVSSQRRRYIPMAFVDPEIIVSGSAQFISDATLETFGVVTSAMHMAWMKTVGGRTKSDFQYTPTLVYNTFPWPKISDEQSGKLCELAKVVLDARSRYPNSLLADLYDPNSMPPDLKKAHSSLDKAVDALYRRRPFESDRERVEHLFGQYEKLIDPLSDAARQNRRVSRRTKA